MMGGTEREGSEKQEVGLSTLGHGGWGWGEDVGVGDAGGGGGRGGLMAIQV